MRSVIVLAALAVAAAGCKKKPAPIAPVDAGPAPSAAMIAPSASASAHLALDGGELTPKVTAHPPPLALASENLEIVAVGKRWVSRILWLQRIGSRVWLSAAGMDAFADGTGKLTKGFDPLEKLPYKPGVHSMKVVGAWPKLYAMRTKAVNGRMDDPEVTVFVYAADDKSEPGTWKQAKPVGLGWFPHAFLAYGDGALLVSSQVPPNAGASWSPESPGTTFVLVGPDGSVTKPTLGIPRSFLAWAGSSDGETVTLEGAIGIPPDKEGMPRPAPGIALLRIKKDGVKTIPIQTDKEYGMMGFGNPIEEHDGRALISPSGGMIYEELGLWKPNARTSFMVGADDKPKPREMPGGEGCYVYGATFIGDAIYFHRHCFSGAPHSLVRLDADGKSAKIALPPIVKSESGGFRPAVTDKEKATGIPCEPVSMLAREPDDLWVQGKCGAADDPMNDAAIPVVYRRGRPQEPVIIP